MSEIDTQIATLLDDVAATIHPTPDFEAVLHGGGAGGGAVAGAPGGGRPFRRGLAVAAASVLLVGGAAAAAFGFDDGDGDPGSLATKVVTTPAPSPLGTLPPDEDGGAPSTTVASEAGDETTTSVAEAAAEHERTARLGEGDLDGDPVVQVVLGTAVPGEAVTVATDRGETIVETGEDGGWKAVLELHDVPPATSIPIRVNFADADTVFEFTVVTPEEEPPATTVAEDPKEEEPPPTTVAKEEPQFVEFTAKLGTSYASASPMKQVLYGTATPGTKILATTAYGHVTATAGEKGNWEAHLKMYEVPAPSNVRITVTASGFAKEFEFWVERPAPEPQPDPDPVAFTADMAAVYNEVDPIKVVFHGTGTPGSVVRLGSDFGVAEVVVGEKGKWETHLRLYEVPAGRTVGIRATNTASEQVFEFSVTKPETVTYDFTANAAFTICDTNPPFNEYWGTATPGSTISISSPYGSKNVTAGELGKWDARIEYPDAPYGVWFDVTITSSKDGGTKVFEFKRVEAV